MKGLNFLICICLSALIVGCSTTRTPRVSDVPVRDGAIHTVQAGETLSAIADTYRVSPELIRRTNNIQDPSAIPPGTKLFIPSATEIKPVGPSGDPVAVIRKDGLWHTVAPGETLIAIANAYREYNVTLKELQQVNNLPDSSLIRSGDRLWIPRALEVKDVPIPQVTIATPQPLPPKLSNDPRVNEKIVKPPREATPTPTRGIGTRAEVENKRKQQEQAAAPAVVPGTIKDATGDAASGGDQGVASPPVAAQPAAPAEEFPREVREFGDVRFQWPLKSSFQVLRTYSRGDMLNPGIDLGAEVGTPVYASADGEVRIVSSVTDDLGESLGNYIILYHGERNKKGIYTIYAHNSQNLVAAGQSIKRGQEIGRVGNTGRPYTSDTGVLHFEIRELDQSIDPMTVLPPLK